MNWPNREATPPHERCLILVKHAMPVVTPGVPPARWVLSDAGRASCGPLAARLRAFAPATVVASNEPKARETARLLAAGLGLHEPLRHDHDLREHERSPEDFFASTADFHDAVRRCFANPDQRIFGRETAAAAEARFSAAVRRCLDATPTGNLIVVAHGTVISLFAAAHAGLEPFALWRSLQLPSYIVLALPDFRHRATCAAVGDAP